MSTKNTLPPDFNNDLIKVFIASIIGTLLLVGLAFFMNLENKEPTIELENLPTPLLAKKKKKNSLKVWVAPDISTIPKEDKDLILYGKDLIVNTATYLGKEGSVMQISNGLNCQNCHLSAGTQPFGNNYSAVAANYPKIRARSGTLVDTEDRINNCFQRSLNGKPLPKESKELKAMIAYIEWLGKDVPEGKKPIGSGLYPITYLDRAADPQKGKLIYDKQCIACHKKNGEGILASDGKSYTYPPLWGDYSYNVSAGLYRVEKFARFVKSNMPFGASHENMILTDEEAWDIAAFINSQPRPDKRFKGDWLNDLIKKPIDAPFGPYADNFSEEQHKYGPYPPIKAAIKKIQTQNKTK